MPPFVDLREEEEESEAESEPEPEFTQPEPEFTAQTAPGIMEEQRIQVQALLNELREGHCPQTPNESMESSTDKSLNLLNYLDFPKL